MGTDANLDILHTHPATAELAAGDRHVVIDDYGAVHRDGGCALRPRGPMRRVPYRTPITCLACGPGPGERVAQLAREEADARDAGDLFAYAQLTKKLVDVSQVWLGWPTEHDTVDARQLGRALGNWALNYRGFTDEQYDHAKHSWADRRWPNEPAGQPGVLIGRGLRGRHFTHDLAEANTLAGGRGHLTRNGLHIAAAISSRDASLLGAFTHPHEGPLHWTPTTEALQRDAVELDELIELTTHAEDDFLTSDIVPTAQACW